MFDLAHSSVSYPLHALFETCVGIENEELTDDYSCFSGKKKVLS